MAAKWADIERDGDEYDLQYRTALDGLVRPEHAALEGITLPPSDKFWNEYYPPNGWNCRCQAVQVLKDKYPTSDSDQACEAGERATTQIGKNGENKAAMFRFNPGKAGKVFPPKHPYYKAPAEAKKKVGAIVATLVTTPDSRDAEYRRYKDDPEYRDVEKNDKGGVKATHVRHEVHTAEKEETFFKGLTKDGKGLTSTQLEQCCQNILFGLGNSAILCEEGIKNASGGVDTSLDLLLNGKRVDIRSVTTQMEIYRNQLVKKNSQIGKFNSLPYVTEKADSVCLYFHDPTMYDPEKVTEGIKKLKGIRRENEETGELEPITIHIKHVYCVINEGKGRKEVFDVE